MMNQTDDQIKIFGIGIVLLVILIKDKISKKVKFTRILYIFKIGYNLVLNRRLHIHRYYFYKDNNMIRCMSDDSELASVLFIKKGLHKLLLAESGMHYASRKSPVNVEIWH